MSVTVYPLPPAYAARMREQLGADADAYFSALEAPGLRGFRLNPRKPTVLPEDFQEAIARPVPWCKTGYYLPLESAAGSHPSHEAGAYYIQEPSAMAPVSVLAPQPGERVLDLCAAPGGKSSQIADALMGDGLLVCNEPVPLRARILSRNLERMGITNALAVCAEPEQLCPLWPEAFDAILVDAPCSGEGMFRRHPETRAEWNENAPAGCAERQRRILACACRMLRPGGRLVYSTCTLNREENDHVADWLLSRDPDMALVPFSLPVGADTPLAAKNGLLHLYPHKIEGEGHFIALFHKRGTAASAGTAFLPAAARLSAPDKRLLAAYADFGNALSSGGERLPIPTAQLGDSLIASSELPPLQGVRVLRAGLQLGAFKGKVFAPDHALAMGLPLPSALPTLALSREEARAYQSGASIAVPDSLKGYALACYRGLSLGFGKASEGQLKNHYPKGLRRP